MIEDICLLTQPISLANDLPYVHCGHIEFLWITKTHFNHLAEFDVLLQMAGSLDGVLNFNVHTQCLHNRESSYCLL